VELGYNLQLQKKGWWNLLRPSDWPTQENPNEVTVSPVHSRKSIIRLCFEILSNCFRFRAQV
jgi:hypothetical protein